LFDELWSPSREEHVHSSTPSGKAEIILKVPRQAREDFTALSMFHETSKKILPYGISSSHKPTSCLKSEKHLE